jgi:CheY-like chemotaxis protein
MLRAIGVEVDIAENGQQALERAREQRPDIVFMDIRMPVMDGSEARQRLVAEHGEGAMSIVAVTASVFEHQQRVYLEEGFDDFIDKPIRAERIYASLAQLLGVVEGEEKPATVARATPTVDWHDLSLPEELRAGFGAAAKTQSITELNKHIDALPDLGPAGESLATHLRALARKYDLRAIRETLAALGID